MALSSVDREIVRGRGVDGSENRFTSADARLDGFVATWAIGGEIAGSTHLHLFDPDMDEVSLSFT